MSTREHGWITTSLGLLALSVLYVCAFAALAYLLDVALT